MNPVKEGDIVESEVMGHGKNGDPILKVKGFTVFVKEATLDVGQYVRVKVTKCFEKFAFAYLEEQ